MDHRSLALYRRNAFCSFVSDLRLDRRLSFLSWLVDAHLSRSDWSRFDLSSGVSFCLFSLFRALSLSLRSWSDIGMAFAVGHSIRKTMTLNTPKKATIGVSALYRRATFKENIAYRHNFIDNQMLSVRKKLTTYATVLSVNAIRVSRAITDILMSTMMNCSTLIAAIVVNNSKNDTAVVILLAMALIHCVCWMLDDWQGFLDSRCSLDFLVDLKCLDDPGLAYFLLTLE